MKKTRLILVMVLVGLLSACSSADRQAYDKNLALWNSKAVQHFRYNLKIGCFCPWTSLMPLTVEERNGQILSITASNGGDISPFLDSLRPYAKIENLFDSVYAAMIRGADSLEVKYDPTYGFPASIAIDPSKKIMDDETGYSVTNFEILP